MEVLTSYYDKAVGLDKNAYTFVRVSRTAPPEGFIETVEDCVDLSDTFGPTRAMLDECPPASHWETFKPRYQKEVLGVLGKAETVAMLENIYAENGSLPLLLTCYEPLPENCHRHLIGDYLGIDIKEL